MVWDETVKIVDDLFQNVWGNQVIITADHCVEVTLPVRRINCLTFTQLNNLC